jgi:hypothetical protein
MKQQVLQSSAFGLQACQVLQCTGTSGGHLQHLALLLLLLLLPLRLLLLLRQRPAAVSELQQQQPQQDVRASQQQLLQLVVLRVLQLLVLSLAPQQHSCQHQCCGSKLSPRTEALFVQLICDRLMDLCVLLLQQ